jgi:hypothetical protein
MQAAEFHEKRGLAPVYRPEPGLSLLFTRLRTKMPSTSQKFPRSPPETGARPRFSPSATCSSAPSLGLIAFPGNCFAIFGWDTVGFLYSLFG